MSSTARPHGSSCVRLWRRADFQLKEDHIQLSEGNWLTHVSKSQSITVQVIAPCNRNNNTRALVVSAYTEPNTLSLITGLCCLHNCRC
jgi:hypothetical protein